MRLSDTKRFFGIETMKAVDIVDTTYWSVVQMYNSESANRGLLATKAPSGLCCLSIVHVLDHSKGLYYQVSRFTGVVVVSVANEMFPLQWSPS